MLKSIDNVIFSYITNLSLYTSFFLFLTVFSLFFSAMPYAAAGSLTGWDVDISTVYISNVRVLGYDDFSINADADGSKMYVTAKGIEKSQTDFDVSTCSAGTGTFGFLDIDPCGMQQSGGGFSDDKATAKIDLVATTTVKLTCSVPSTHFNAFGDTQFQNEMKAEFEDGAGFSLVSVIPGIGFQAPFTASTAGSGTAEVTGSTLIFGDIPMGGGTPVAHAYAGDSQGTVGTASLSGPGGVAIEFDLSADEDDSDLANTITTGLPKDYGNEPTKQTFQYSIANTIDAKLTGDDFSIGAAESEIEFESTDYLAKVEGECGDASGTHTSIFGSFVFIGDIMSARSSLLYPDGSTTTQKICYVPSEKASRTNTDDDWNKTVDWKEMDCVAAASRMSYDDDLQITHNVNYFSMLNFLPEAFGQIAPSTGSDSDSDGISNANDQCPNQPETYNNFQDFDGCPDTTMGLEVGQWIEYEFTGTVGVIDFSKIRITVMEVDSDTGNVLMGVSSTNLRGFTDTSLVHDNVFNPSGNLWIYTIPLNSNVGDIVHDTGTVHEIHGVTSIGNSREMIRVVYDDGTNSVDAYYDKYTGFLMSINAQHPHGSFEINAQNSSLKNSSTITVVPSWFKDVANWWSQDLISDREYFTTLDYLIQINVITIN